MATMKVNYWQDKVCVITGATAGLGLAVARALAARDAKLVLVARGREQLRQTANALGPAVAVPVVADVTNPDDVSRLSQAVMDQFGNVDFLCNCAGRSARQRVLDTSIDEFQEMLEVNFLAPVRMAQAFAPTLVSQRGHIVNVGSLASKVAPRYLAGYPASKFALAAFSQQLRLELGPEGLHVLLVCPGPIRRSEAVPRYQQHSAGLPSSAQQQGAGANLRPIDPDWLANKILYACERRRLELIVPWKVRLLVAAAQIWPRLSDRLLLRATSSD
ncbi:MAG: SDR family NAD(P)-dependent oxidoreductase [Pirellulales bacterium]|nr:SDR family NAD(P)-dependent oxidoreductase [Pirellulales bacterium]